MKISKQNLIILLLVAILFTLISMYLLIEKEQNQCIENPLSYTAMFLKKSAGVPVYCSCYTQGIGQNTGVHFDSEGNVNFNQN